ncbi:hypothetical protein Hdeb2414_s0039g00735361 [Helianthus debilis subsp. tardiflorus]
MVQLRVSVSVRCSSQIGSASVKQSNGQHRSFGSGLVSARVSREFGLFGSYFSSRLQFRLIIEVWMIDETSLGWLDTHIDLSIFCLLCYLLKQCC